MKSNKTILYIIIALVIIGGGYAMLKNEKADNNSDVIKIGYFGPLTGPLAGAYEESVNSLRLAEEEKQKIGSKTIKVLYEDDMCDPKKAVSAAQKLIDVDKVKILISGVCSSSTLAVAPLAESNRVILITPIAATPNLTTAGDYVFRITASSEVRADVSAEMIKKLSYKKLGILYEKNEYSVTWKDVFEKKFKETPGNTIVSESVNSADTDVKSQLLKLQNEDVDALVYVFLTPALQNIVLKQTKEFGIKKQIIGNETFSMSVVTDNPDAEGMIVTMYKYDTQSPETQHLISSYEKKYGTSLKDTMVATLGYDVYNVLYDGIVYCKDNYKADCIKDYLYSVQNYKGSSGMISIDKNGDAVREFILRRIHNKKLEDINQ